MKTIHFNNRKVLFTQISTKDLDFIKKASSSYITTENLMRQLEIVDLPIKRETAIKRILAFLEYLDERIKNGRTEIGIDQSIWEEYFSPNKYKQYQEILSQLNILTTVMYKRGSYIDKKGTSHTIENDFAYSKKLGLSKIFQVHNSYLKNENYVMVMFGEKQKTASVQVDIRLKNLSPKFVNTLKNVKIDVPGAIQAEINEYHKQKISFIQLKHRISRIFAVRNSRKISTGNKVNRIYHSFTNLSKISRQFFNHKFFEIDVVNCQPTLLIAYLYENNLGIDENYKRDCESGSFYERFIDTIDEKYTFGDDLVKFDQARKETKVSIYRNVFFGFKKSEKINIRFKELYPLTWAELDKIKKSTVSLASILQNTEAQLFNSLFPKKSKMYFTLFDAVYYTNDEDTAELKNKIEQFFNERNVNVKIEKK